MMVKVNKDACIGCGACQAIVSDVFDIDDDGLAYVLEDAKIEENIDDVKEAADNCPTEAIIVEEN
ncbi:MAG: ferredoxin [Firmicutes bacterium]|nr:ferredoxin [Bacillota bacterium]